MEQRNIAEVARRYLGTPFKHQGRTLTRGIDCVGFLIVVGADFGLTIRAPDHYAEAPASNLVVKYADGQLVKCPDKLWLPNRIALMWGFDRNEAQHVAIVGEHAGRPTMIHAFSKAGKVVEHSVDAFWMKRLVQMYEFPLSTPEVFHG